MFTIKAAAERVGVSPATLRAWERRYGLPSPARTEAGYRLYSPDDVRVLRRVADLVRGGTPASLAAEEALSRPTAPGPTPPDGATGELLRAAADLDAATAARVLDRVFGAHSFETAIDDWVLPSLTALGEAWADGTVSVAGEHLVANAVMRRLAQAYEAAAGPRTGPRVLIGTGPGTRHELGLFAFAVAARRQGLNTDYLGADLPVDEWQTALLDPDVVAVVISMPGTADVAPVEHVAAAAARRDPPVLVAVGGAEQDRAPRAALRLGHQIGPAADALAGELARLSRR